MRQFILLLILTAAVAADQPLIQPKDLAEELSAAGSAAKPIVLQVGPNVLYRSKHIPGAGYAGPAAKPDGLDLLKNTVAKLPRDREIVLYCGCCPWDRCPNIRPAVELLQGMGFQRVRALSLPTDFKADWIDRGYPVEPAAAR
jgi:thiosulfate/3-mercaptopyruvate sulfurtransferase